MRFFWVFEINDEKSRVCCMFTIQNRSICAVLGFFQLIIASASLYQHIYSITEFGHVFHCQSNISSDASLSEHFLAYDIIIFDYGLMHQVLGTTECVANYLDGGYMRGLWCFQQMSSLVTMYLGMYCFIKYTWMLWPALLIESSYALGMAILTMATAPKLLEAIGSRADQDFYFRLSIFLTGMLCNWLFTFALWHYYWFIEDRLRERQNRQLFEI